MGPTAHEQYAASPSTTGLPSYYYGEPPYGREYCEHCDSIELARQDDNAQQHCQLPMTAAAEHYSSSSRHPNLISPSPSPDLRCEIEVEGDDDVQLRLMTSDANGHPLDVTDLSLYYNGRQSSSSTSPPDLTVLVDSPLSSSGDGHRRDGGGHSPDSVTNSGGSASLTSKNTTLDSARLNDTLDSGFVTTKGSDKGENLLNDTFDSDHTTTGLLLRGGGERSSSHHEQQPMTTIFDCEQGCFISVEEYNRRYGRAEKLWYEQ